MGIVPIRAAPIPTIIDLRDECEKSEFFRTSRPANYPYTRHYITDIYTN